MTWQDELRRLDEELAAGRLSADEYRQRRDQLLAASNNPNSGAQPVQQPPQQPGGPFPPPFRWDGAGQPGNADATQMVPGAMQPGADATQVVPGGMQPGADATQVVPGGQYPNPANPDATQVVPGGQYPNPANPDATQVVSGFNQQGGADATQVVPSPAAGFPQQHPQAWAAQQQQYPQQQAWAAQQQLPNQQQGWPQQGGQPGGTPWGGGDASGEPAWMRQGPEVFEEGGSGKTGKIIAIVAVIVVLAGIAVGAVFLFNNNKSPEANPPASTTSSTQPAASGKIATGLPGHTQTSVSKGVKTFTDVTSMQTPLLSPPESNAFETAGAADTSLLYNDVNGSGFLVMVVQAESPDAAKQAAADLHAQQLKFGLAAKTSPVTGASVDGKDDVADSPQVPVLRRVHYSSGNYIIRIEVRGKDAATAESLLQTVLSKQAAVLKPDAS